MALYEYRDGILGPAGMEVGCLCSWMAFTSGISLVVWYASSVAIPALDPVPLRTCIASPPTPPNAPHPT